LASPAGALAPQRKAPVNNLTEDDKIMLCIVGAFGAAVVLIDAVYTLARHGLGGMPMVETKPVLCGRCHLATELGSMRTARCPALTLIFCGIQPIHDLIKMSFRYGVAKAGFGLQALGILD
jgi:hypothetical protein